MLVCLLSPSPSLPVSLSPPPQIGTGFKDDELEQHTKFLKDHVIEKPKSYYRFNENGVTPDHWFDAVQVSLLSPLLKRYSSYKTEWSLLIHIIIFTQVWEVKAADLSISPVYTAAAGIVSHIIHSSIGIE